MSENEKEAKKASESESFEVYRGEAAEDAQEESGLEEGQSSEERRVPNVCPVDLDFLESDSDSIRVKSASSSDSNQDAKAILLREKWMKVTGKKPKSIPNLRKPFDESGRGHVFFGDKKPGEVEHSIRRKLLIAAQHIEHLGLKFGKVRLEMRLPAFFSGLQCIRFDPTAQFMTCSNRTGGVEVRKTSTGEAIMNLETIERKESLAIKSVRYLPTDSNKIFVVGKYGCVQVFSAETGDLLGSSQNFGSTYNMDISSDGFYLVMGGKEGNIHIIDPENLQLISKRTWPTNDALSPNVSEEYHKMRIYGLRCHPKYTNLFATCGWDRTLKIWDTRVQPAIRSVRCPSMFGDGLDLQRNIMATASWQVENSLNLWDFPSGRLIKNIPIKCKSTRYEGEFLYACRFFPEHGHTRSNSSDMLAVGGSGFFDVIVIDTKTNQTVQYFPSFKPIMCLDVSGNMLAYGGTESVFRIAEVEERHQKHAPRHET